MKVYTQINLKTANQLYRRPANQTKSDSLMTNKAYDTHLTLHAFLDLKSRVSLNDSSLSHETVDPYLKKFAML